MLRKITASLLLIVLFVCDSSGIYAESVRPFSMEWLENSIYWQIYKGGPIEGDSFGVDMVVEKGFTKEEWYEAAEHAIERAKAEGIWNAEKYGEKPDLYVSDEDIERRKRYFDSIYLPYPLTATPAPTVENGGENRIMTVEELSDLIYTSIYHPNTYAAHYIVYYGFTKEEWYEAAELAVARMKAEGTWGEYGWNQGPSTAEPFVTDEEIYELRVSYAQRGKAVPVTATPAPPGAETPAPTEMVLTAAPTQTISPTEQPKPVSTASGNVYWPFILAAVLLLAAVLCFVLSCVHCRKRRYNRRRARRWK